MKTPVRFLSILALAAPLLFAAGARAALVPPGGYTNDFATQPPAADWATVSVAGGATDTYTLDTDVNASVTAAGVTAQTTPATGTPAAGATTAIWNSAAFHLQTRPTQNRYTVLMGKFVNDTGTNATQITLAYQLTSPGGGVAEEADRGTRVYYSFTGLAGSWTNLAALNNTISAAGVFPIATNLALNWTNGGSLFLLWADDNAMGNPTDSGNQIDNFSLAVTAGVPPISDLTLFLTAPTNGALFVAGAAVPASAAVLNGAAPHTVEYFVNGGGGYATMGSSATPPFSVNLGPLAAGAYHLYAVVTDSTAVPLSTNSVTNIFTVADPITATLAGPANGASFDNLTPVTGAVSVSGGNAPYSVQFFLDGAASGSPLTSPPYERDFGALPVGDRTVRATVTDARGWVSNSATHTIHITGPLAVTLTPTNGTAYNYGQPVTVTAVGGGGTAPYSVTFLVNNQPLGPLATPPFTTNLGVLAPGDYAVNALITDSGTPAPALAESGTNVITILPNPLLATLTSPTNGQPGVTGQPFNLAASVAVNAPVTVASVEFFFNGSSAGVDSNAPYSASVTGPAPGSYPAYAVATDSLGRTSFTATNLVAFVIDPLANNHFTNRFTLPTPATVTGANPGANTEGGEPTSTGGFGGTTWGATLWWRWTAPVAGTVIVDTIGSDFNTYLAVYTGTAVNGLTLVQRNNDAPGLANVSLVSFTAQAGTEYAIQVGGVQSGFGGGAVIATGNIQLNLAVPPAVSITNIVAGAVFGAGTNIPVHVTASSVVGTVTKVDLYRSGSLVGTVSNAPYSFVVTNAPPGTNALYAVATDSIGQIGTSPTINVLVANPGITLVSPLDGALFATTNPITVSAYALLSSGSITSVTFVANGQEFATDATAPFSGVWSGVTPGAHRLTAGALDDAGNSYAATPIYVAVTQPLVASNAVWKYLADGTDQGTAWFASGFDDGAWTNGPAELGYGDNDEATVVPSGPAGNFFVTTYFRHAFNVTNAAAFAGLSLGVLYDDAVAVYLNGAEIYRSPNLPAGAGYNTLSTGAATEEAIAVVTLPATGLVAGTNVIAAEVHQQAIDSSDVSFVLQLSGVPAIIRNTFPLVEIYDPTNTAFLAPSVLTFNATATDPDGSVTNVAFFASGVKIGDGAQSPGTDSYGVAWNSPAIGSYAVTAVATDNQGAVTVSAARPVVIYDAAGTPLAQVTSPANGVVMEGPTNLTITATALGYAALTNLQFAANGVVFGSDATAPYAANWVSSFGTNLLTAIATDANGLAGTSAPVTVVITIPPTNTVAPTLLTQAPLGGATLTNLTNITVTFSERVQGVDASDLLVNGVPATSVIGVAGSSNYTFRFAHPPYGQVTVSFAAGHGITDYGFPDNLPFDDTGAGATWLYELIDRTPPVVAVRTPAPGVTVTNLTQVSITFSEAVAGVDAPDLILNGTPAFGVTGAGSNYVFMVSQPPSGTITASWAANHGITDVAETPNAFSRINTAWTFTLDARTVLVQTNSAWRFVKGTNEASAPATAWREPLFDDSAWGLSAAPFLFGEAAFTNAAIPGTDLGDMTNNAYTSLYLRRTFVVPNLAAVTNLFLNHQSDDGFIAWINGVEVLRHNMPTGEIAFNGGATVQAAESGGQGGVAYAAATLTNVAAALVGGTNHLAVHAFNFVSTPASSDFVFNAQLYTYVADAALAAPRIAQAMPAPGDVLALTNLTIAFSEGVTNVEAADLLVNGVAATNVTSATNAIYTFAFPQPAFGPVVVSWATNHGIVDFDSPPKPFNGSLAGSILNYILINPSNPRVAAQAPAAGTTVTGLTAIVVTFTEPVTGVNASDLLVTGIPAGAVNSADNTTFNFTFPQPPFGAVTVRWATNHGIADVEAGNAFDPTRFGGQWNYTLVNPLPTVALTSPTNGAYILAPANIPLGATASDNDGTIARVEFLEGAASLGVVSNAPYSLIRSNAAAAFYTFRAVATDNSGISITSAPVSVNVVTALPAFLTRGPYLQSGSTTSAIVRWRTDQFTDGVVRYGTDPTDPTEWAGMAVEATSTNEHIVRITGLQPDTQYYYSIGSSGQRLAGTNGVGSDYWFKTSPVPGTRKPTRLWLLGDAGTAGNGSADRQNSTRDAFNTWAATNGGPPDLWLMLGDNAYNTGTDAEHQRAIFDIYPSILRNKFLWPTIGNHETALSTTATDFPYLHIFSLPTAGESGGVASGTEKYYSFDYGNIHFVCLDSMTSGRTATTPMATWLQNDLAATTAEWIIVFFHHPPYTKGSHNSDTEADLVQLRQNLNPIFEANGVDMVLGGHSHCYERSFLMQGHYGLSGTLTPSMKLDGGDGRVDGDGPYRKKTTGEGVVYSVAGSAGQATFLQGDAPHPAMFFTLLQLGTLVLDISSNRLDGTFVDSTGIPRDNFTIIKPVPGTPDAPLNLTARFTNQNAVRLSWTDAATNELAYLVERSVSGSGFAHLLTVPANTTVALDTGVAPNTTYLYRVRATNAIALSDYSNIASVTTTNRPPVAGPDSFYRFLGQNLTIPASTLLANDSDADGDPLALAGVTPASAQGGTVSIVGQSVIYVPANGFNGPDSFSYTVADGRGGSNSALVSITVSSNTAPQLTPVPDWITGVLVPVVLTNSAADADQPANALAFSLVAAPPEARLHTNSGRFYWNPSRADANTTNLITVRVADNGVPPLSATTSFTITVRDYVELTAGEAVLRAGATSSVPLEVTASAGLTALQFALHFADNRLTNLSLEALSPLLTGSTLQSNGPGSALLTFSASPAQPLQGPLTLARLHFGAATARSAFLPLDIGEPAFTRAAAGLAPSAILNPGRVTVIENEPLVEALLGTNNSRSLMLYGRVGVTYTIETTTSLNPPLWTAGQQVPMTNLFHAVPLTNPPSSLLFYRARE